MNNQSYAERREQTLKAFERYVRDQLGWPPDVPFYAYTDAEVTTVYEAPYITCMRILDDGYYTLLIAAWSDEELWSLTFIGDDDDAFRTVHRGFLAEPKLTRPSLKDL